MTAPLIGLIGRKRAGKDTVAAQLIREFGAERLAFADALRRVLYRVNPIVTQYTLSNGAKVDTRVQRIVDSYGWEAAKEDPEVRRLLQEVGTVYRDEVDMDAWLRPVVDKAEELREDGKPVVVTDVRFPNEALAIKSAGGILVRVVRYGYGDDVNSLHISETALDEWPVDWWLQNDGSLDDLAFSVRTLGHHHINRVPLALLG